MEKDFHYYLIYALAKLADFEEAAVIAYSSQFTDDNNEGQFSLDGEETFFPRRIKANGSYYYPVMTQSLSPKSLDPCVQKYVYVPFHFVPGDNSVAIEGKRNPFSTTPNSPNAQALLHDALDSGNAYRIGIALHAYVDTWSHQNFSGLDEEWNAVYPWYNVFKSLVPDIGHADAGHAPDIISESWTDYRFGNKKIDNRERAFNAVRETYGVLRRETGSGPLWKDVAGDFREIVGVPDYDGRIKKISQLLNSRRRTIPDYSKDAWIDDALDKSGGEVVMKPDFTGSHWFRFHQAAKAHLAKVMDLIKDL